MCGGVWRVHRGGECLPDSGASSSYRESRVKNAVCMSSVDRTARCDTCKASQPNVQRH